MSVDERVLDALGPAFRERAGDLLPELVAALTVALDDVDELLAPTDGGWPAVFDLDLTPMPAWLGQLGGTIVPGGMTLEQQRAYVRDRPAWRRGTPGAMVAAVQQLLTGTKRVELIERDGSPWRLTIRVWAPEATGVTEEQIIAAAATQKPVGLVIIGAEIAVVTLDHIAREHGPTLEGIENEFPTLEDIENHVPEWPIRGATFARMGELYETFEDEAAAHPTFKSARDFQEA